jgi:hypothetical protein
MRSSSLTRTWLAAFLCGMLCFSAFASTTSKKKQVTTGSSSSAKSAAHKKHSRGKGKSKSAKSRGQKAIESDRTTQIQEALIREHYMSGEPSGKWDDSTQAALRRYQADQGWQSKSVPDSRALIKLGLGPNHDHLLNPESAMTTSPDSVAHKSSKSNQETSVQAPSTPAPDVPQK